MILVIDFYMFFMFLIFFIILIFVGLCAIFFRIILLGVWFILFIFIIFMIRIFFGWLWFNFRINKFFILDVILRKKIVYVRNIKLIRRGCLEKRRRRYVYWRRVIWFILRIIFFIVLIGICLIVVGYFWFVFLVNLKE